MALVQKIQILAISAVAVSATGSLVSYYTKFEDKKGESKTPEKRKEVKAQTPIKFVGDLDLGDWLGTTKETKKTNLDWF